MISIVAPMYNEELNINSTFEKITNELSKIKDVEYEIIFVNDGSTDNTLQVAKALADKNDTLHVTSYNINQGRGKALRTGFDYAKGDYIISVDFDLSYDASHITAMIETLDNDEITDAVFVSVYMPGGKAIGVPPFRLFISKMGNLMYRHVFSKKLYTSTCVVRAYRNNAIKSLVLESDDKEIHLEIISKLLAQGFKIKEIPGTLTKRAVGKSKFKFKSTSLSHLMYLIHEKPFLLFGFLGFFLMLVGFVTALILIYSRFSGDNEFAETFIARIASPNVVIILFLFGFQMLGTGFIGIQNNILKKELFKLQSHIKSHK